MFINRQDKQLSSLNRAYKFSTAKFYAKHAACSFGDSLRASQ